MALLGTPALRTEDPRLLVGGATYISNLDLPGAAAVAFVTSPVAHGRIVGIDVEDARAMPGVLDVVTGEDVVELGTYPLLMPHWPQGMARWMLPRDTVRFVGEAVVAIVATTPEAAADAADLVILDIDPLDVLTDPEASLRGEVLLFPDHGDNVVCTESGGSDDIDLSRHEVVLHATLHSARVAPCPLETRAAAARWEPDGRLTHWSSCQGAHANRNLLAKVYGLPDEQVRVIAPDVGGSFGAKSRAYPEEVVLPLLARRVGRPVRWLPDRSTDMVGLGHARAQVQHLTVAGRRDGTIEALQLRIVGDAGAYPQVGAMLPRNTGALLPGVYRIPQVSWEMASVLTTTTPTVAYRGAGRPEAAAVCERAIDLFAAEIGMDPVEVRRRNLIRPEELPYTTPTGVTYDSGDYGACLDRALAMIGYDEVRAEQARRRAAGERVQLGVGVATFLDRTGAAPGGEYGSTELRADGTVLVRTGSSPFGQGHYTTWAMLVADRTGLPLERIEVTHGDTDVVPRGDVTGGSRSVQRAGAAVASATEAMVARARQVAADQLEAAVEDVVLDVEGGGRFHVAGTPARALDWVQVATAALAEGPLPDGDQGALRCEADEHGGASFPCGAYVAVVELDVETGQASLRRLVTVDDAGTIVNPRLALGQVHGGAAQGAAQALLEEFVYDDQGNPLTVTFADYSIASATELPSFETDLLQTPTPHNPLGAKGIAESGTIGAPPAVQNAVVDALAHLGVTHIDMPCTPERVWRALADAAAR